MKSKRTSGRDCLIRALILTAALHSDGVLAANSLQVFPPKSAGGGAASDVRYFFERLAESHVVKPDDLKLKVQVSLALENRRSIYGVTGLEWDARTQLQVTPASARVEVGAGWSRIGNHFMWIPGGKAENLAVPFSAPSSERGGLSLADYDELWVDYRELVPDYPCAVSAKIVMDLKGFDSGRRTRLTTVTAETVSRAAEEIDASAADWVAKDRTYGLRRLLRRAPDEKWRYVAWHEFAVIQRRLHRDLSDMAAIYVEFSPGFHVEGLNLRIGTRDDYGPGEIFELMDTPEVTVAPSGNKIWRVDVQKIMMERFPGKKAYLQEIVAFVKSSVDDAVRSRPLRKVIFQRLEPLRTGDTPLPAKIETITPSLKRLVVSLSVLKRSGYAFLRNGHLSVRPRNTFGPGGVTIEKMRVVSLGRANLPAFLRGGEDLNRRWGGPFIDPPDSEEMVEWPEVAAYLDFIGAGARLVEPGRVPRKSGPLRLTGERKELSIRSDRPFTLAGPGIDGLVLEGFGRWIEASWRVSASVDKGTIFFLAVPKGADQIWKTVLTVSFEKGADLRLTVSPNRPVPLLRKGEIKRLSFKMFTFGPPFRLKLKEGILFHSVLLTKKEAFTHRITSGITEKPAPVVLMESASRELNQWRVLYAGGAPIAFASGNGIENKILEGPIQLTAESGVVPKMAVSGGGVEPVQNQWFKVDSAVIVPGPSLPQGAWEKLIEKPLVPLRSPFLSRLLRPVLFLVLGCLLWKVLGETRKNALVAWWLKTTTIQVLCSARFWLAAVIVLYGMGMNSRPEAGENYYFTSGGLAAVFFLRFALGASSSYVRTYSRRISDFISTGSGQPYFACAILALLGTGGGLALQMHALAEQLTVIAYYGFVIGTVKEGIELSRDQ